MALFSNFCDICYKIDNESLKDISQVNMKHLNDILITFVGHADIINYNVIHLCHLCCVELTHVDKFREMCLSNLIQMRQRYINMTLEDNACAVQNTLQKFVYEEVLRNSSLEKSNGPVLISTDCHGIIKGPEYVNKDCLDFNRQVTNLQLETNECDIKGACSKVSGINSVTECDESPVAVTNDDIKNKMLTPENTKLEKFEGESDEDFDVSDANNDNKSDTSQIDFIKEEYDLKSERENNDSENLALKNDENEFDEHANLDVKMPVLYNSGGGVSSGIAFTKEELIVKQENSDSKGLELQTMEDGFGDGLNVAFQIANVSTIVNMEERENGNIRSEDAKGGMKLRNRGSNNTLPAATVDAQPSEHVRQYRNRRSSKVLQSDAHNRVYPCVETHTCTVCNKSFRSSRCLTRHARMHNDGSPYKCTVCNKKFTQSCNLTIHERIHSGDRPYKCTICNKTFTQSGSLTIHKRIHSGVRPFKCNICNKTFRQLTSLNYHEHMHSGAKPYKCTICNKTFGNSSNLTTHERIHSDARPFKCTICNKTFRQLASLTTHKRIHSGVRPFKCNICNKTFTQSGSLTNHERIHSGAKPYKCTICNKTFGRSSYLTGHKRVHSGARPYKCTICNKTFARSATLTNHERIHSGTRAFKCTICNKTFKQSSSLNNHEAAHSTSLIEHKRTQ